MADNGTFTISGLTNGGTSIKTLSGNGVVTLGANTLTLSAASSTFSGAIGGTGGLTVAAGTETLTGTNGYTGGTTINSGATLALSGAGSIAASSVVTDNGTFTIAASNAPGATITTLAGSGVVTLGSNTLTISNGSTTFGGVIGGTGGLTTAGGNQTLSGTNTYTGVTTINAGSTLSLAGTGSISTSSGVADAGTFNIAPLTNGGTTITTLSGAGKVTLGGNFLTLSNASGVFSGVASGTGGLTLTAGTETLTGANTYTGVTTIYGGLLRIDGSVASPVVVNNTGTLRGAGTINGNLTANPGSTVAPGGGASGSATSGPGNLTVNGNVTLSSAAGALPGSVLSFDIDGPTAGTGAGNFSTLTVSGSLTAAGTIQPLLRGIAGSANNTYVPTYGTAFTVITTGANGLLGSFDQMNPANGAVTGLGVNSRFDALYNPASLQLIVTPGSYGTLAGSNWSAPVGFALDGVRPAPGVRMTPALDGLFRPLYVLTNATAITTTLQQMAPLAYADSALANRSTFYSVTGAINDELRARRNAPGAAGTKRAPAAGDTGQDTMVWVAGLGNFLNLSSGNNGVPGYQGTSGGVVAGVDTQITPEIRIGLAVGFNSQDLSVSNSERYSGQAVQVSAYGTATVDEFFVDAQLSGIFTEGTANRMVSAYGLAPKGDVSGSGIGGSVKGGMRLALADGWNVEPSVMLSGLSLDQGSVTETNGGAVGQRVSGQSLRSLQTTIGFSVDRSIDLGESYLLVPSVSAGWAHEFGDVQVRTNSAFQVAPAAAFSINSAGIGRDAAVVGAHATLLTGTPLSVFAGYDAAVSEHNTSQSVTGGLRFNW